MNFDEIYNAIFCTPLGVGILILCFLVIGLLAAFILEKKTRRTFVDRPKDKDAWSLFDDEDDEEEDED